MSTQPIAIQLAQYSWRDGDRKAPNTPWGRAQYRYDLVPDGSIYSVGTAGHGGIKVTAKHNKKIPEYLREKKGWYEEDCAWCIPYVCLPELFDPEKYTQATATMRRWYWQGYEQYFGIKIPVSECPEKRAHLAWEALKGYEHILISASNNDDGTVTIVTAPVSYAKNRTLDPANFAAMEAGHVETTIKLEKDLYDWIKEKSGSYPCPTVIPDEVVDQYWIKQERKFHVIETARTRRYWASKTEVIAER